MEGVDECLVKVAHRAIEITKIDFGIPETGGVRTPQQQHQLFLDLLSKADGMYKRSKHQDGLALDVFAYHKGEAKWGTKYLAQVACAFLQAANELGIKIKWGGLWSTFRDMPHFELEC